MKVTERPTVAVCIPTYNQSQYLSQAVLSACNQTYPDVEVWVADDASTDETPAIMAALRQQYPQVRYHRQPQNCGIAENSSWLLRQPKTEFVVRLDSDDLLAPEYVDTLVNLAVQYPNAGYAHTAVQEIGKGGELRRIRRVARSTGFQDGETALRASVSGYRTAANILMFRAEVLRELNFYEGRPEFTEDYDFAVRMADAGYGNVYVDRTLASYRVWADDEGKRAKRKKIQLEGYIRIFDESMIPAFQRRGWNTQPIVRQRRRLAELNAAYCCSPRFSLAERTELIALLVQLGDSPSLRARLIVTRVGLGFIFEWQSAAIYGAKEFVKAGLSRCRS